MKQCGLKLRNKIKGPEEKKAELSVKEPTSVSHSHTFLSFPRKFSAFPISSFLFFLFLTVIQILSISSFFPLSKISVSQVF